MDTSIMYQVPKSARFTCLIGSYKQTSTLDNRQRKVNGGNDILRTLIDHLSSKVPFARVILG